MSSELIKRFSTVPGCYLSPSENAQKLRSELDKASLLLPDSHLEVLSLANGIKAYYGYFRLFGVGSEEVLNIEDWNNPKTWKFAWEKDLSDFVCFGETAWGDQYAYRLSELKSRKEPPVYFLEGVAMVPEVIADDFQVFFDHEFYRCAKEPYDDVVKVAAQKLGSLDWNDHIIYIPSLLLGGEEKIENVSKINARSGMIINGDIHRQSADQAFETEPKSIETYTDSEGRERVRVVWQ